MRLFASHFGTYEVEQTRSGAALRPFRHDEDPSPIGARYLDLATSPDRVAAPMVRRSILEAPHCPSGHLRGREPFVAVDWATALDLVAARIEAVRRDHGAQGIFAGTYGWSSAGRFHHAQSQLKRFLNLLGGFTYSVNSYSYGTAAVLLPHVLGIEHGEAGDCAPSWDGVADDCKLLIAFGGFRITNAQVQAGGVGRHRTAEWIERAQAKGMRLIVLSASRGDIPPGTDAEYLPLRPNSDAAVMLAMCHVLFAEELADLEFLDTRTSGYATFRAYVMGESDGIPRTPAWAEAISGVPAATIAALARGLRAQRSLINVAWSLQRARFGEQPYWAAVALAGAAGHVGKRGGGISFGLTAVGSIGQPVRPLKGPSLPQGKNAVRDFIPVSRITELLSQPGGMIDYDGRKLVLPDIRLVWWCGGNPFHHHQNLRALRRAWERPETVIVSDPMWTATARLADIVLPSALPFERNDLVAGSRDNWIIASRRVQPPPAPVRTDFETFADLAARFGISDAFTEGRDEMTWIQHLYSGYRANHPDLPEFEAFWEQGYAGIAQTDDVSKSWTALEAFVADPAGAPLSTASGRIEIESAEIASFGYADCPGHPIWLPPEEWLGSPLAKRFPLHLLSPQPSTRLHSQLGEVGESKASLVAGHEPVLIHPTDARTRGIINGDVVMLFNDRGRTLAGAVLTRDVMRGVVVLATGAKWLPDEQNQIDRGGNPNTLTSDVPSSRLSQGCGSGSCLVQILRWVEPESLATI